MVRAVTCELVSHEDTWEFGRRLGARLTGGDLVVLSGPLGAGKTVVAKGIAAGLGVRGRVSSPTFVLARVHEPGSRGIGMVHVDAYRLGGDLDQLADLDIDPGDPTTAFVVEWGEELLTSSPDYLLVRLERRADDVREVSLEPHGSWRQRLSADLVTLPSSLRGSAST